MLEISKQIMVDMDCSLDFDSACCVDEAFKKLSTGQYDIVISDYGMPQKDGLQFLKELREQKNDIPFVLFTGKGREEVAIEALNRGADRYFNKQGNTETVYGELVHGIMQLVNQKRLSKKLSAEEERFRQLFSNTPMAVAIYEVINDGEDFVFKDFNSAAEKIEKIDKAAVLGKRVTYVFPGVKNFGVFEVFKRVWKTGKTEYFPAAIYQDNQDSGSWRENWIIKLPNDNIAAMYNDITERKKDEEKLSKSEDKYRNLADSLPEIVFETDLNGKLTYANHSAFETTGYTKEDFAKGVCAFDLVEQKDKDRAKEHFKKTLTNKPFTDNEFTFVRKDGSTFPTIIVSKPIVIENRTVGLRGIAVDITERKKAEKSSKKQAALIDLSPDAVIVKNMDETITFWNTGAEKLYGYTKQEALGQKINILLKAKHSKSFDDVITQLKQGKNWTGEITNYTKNNNEVIVQSYWSATLNAQGDIVEILESNVDITQRKKAAEVVIKSAARYRELANSLPEIVFEIDLTGKITFFSQRALEITGFTREELEKGFNILSVVVPEERERAMENIKKSLAEEDHGANEYTLFRKDGTTYPAIVRTAPIISENKVIGLRGLALDITDRKKTEKALQESETKFRMYVENSPVAVFVANTEGKYEYVNEAASKLLGYSAKELMGMSIHPIVFKAELPAFFDNFATVQKTGKILKERRLKNKDGQAVYAILNAVKLPDGKLMAFCENITERKHAEEALKESEKRSRAIVANSPIGIATSGADKHFLSANEAFCRILGYTEDELRKLTFKDITHSENLKESVIKMGELENGRISSFTLEKRYVKKDGTVIDGKIMVSAVRNQNGKPSLFIAELEDITERKKAEDLRKVLERKVNDYSEHLKSMVDLRTVQLKDANERLVKSERLAAIGELAGMVGHDLRNPLTGIKNAAYYLKKKGATISEVQAKEMLEAIDKAIDHSNKIINDLLDYSREMYLELTKYAARTLVDEATRMIQVPDRIQIVNHVLEKTWIWVNADKMMRVFINLIKNAIDAMPEKGTLKISSCQTEDCVEIVFADTGTGIPEEALPKIFTPLFTTKAQGMGFGLAICKRIIEAHGGTITVKTTVNKGTTFTITLPIKPKAPTSQKDKIYGG